MSEGSAFVHQPDGHPGAHPAVDFQSRRVFVTDTAHPRALEGEIVDQWARVAVRPAALSLSILYAIFTVGHILVLEGTIRTVMAALAVVSAGLLFGIARLPLAAAPPRKVNAAAGGIAAVAIVNSLAHLGLSMEPLQTTNLLFTILGTALLIYSMRWAVSLLVVQIVGWWGIAWQHLASPEWSHMAFALVSATVLATVIIWGRSRLISALATALHSERTERAAAELDAAWPEKLFEVTPGLLGIHDLNGTLTSVSQSAASAIGIPAEYLLGQSFFDFLWTPDSPESHEYIRDLREQGRASGEVEVRHADGGRRVWKYSAAKVEGSEGTRVVVAGENITALDELRSELEHEVSVRIAEVEATSERLREELGRRQTVESELRSIAEEMRAILDALPDIVLRFNAKGELLSYALPTEVDFLDVSEAAGRPIEEVAPPSFAKMCREAIDSAIGSESIQRGECRVQLDGTGRAFEGRFAPNGEREVVAVIRDVTSQRLLSAELEQAQRLDTVGRLAGGIAHDFNNILTALLGYTELAREAGPEDASWSSYLDRIAQGGTRARDLVQQILAFSGQARTDREPFLVQDIVGEALGLLRPSVPSTVKIRLDVDDDCAAVVGDPTQIHQLVMNLCTNACQAMEDEGGVLSLSLSMAPFESDETFRLVGEPGLEGRACVCLRVADTGCGMSEEVVGLVFDPFFTTKAPGRGSGLGLSVSHRIVQSHGGALRLRSEPGSGTEFEIYLPLAENIPATAPVIAPPVERGSERILLVDDEEMIVTMMTNSLEKLGYDVDAYTSPVEGLEAFQRRPHDFDLVIVDQTMPDLTGTEFISKVQSERPGLPAILQSGWGRFDRDFGDGQGPVAMIDKPFRISTVAETIRGVLDDEG